MAHHNSSSMSEDELVTAAQPMADDTAERTEQLQVLKSSERLTEYYNQVVAEIRASLERIEQEDPAS